MLLLAPLTFYIGTYTSVGGSQGIYQATLDPATGAISAPVLAAQMRNPSYVALSTDGNYLYAVDESSHGSVHAFSLGITGQLGALNSQPLAGSAPCHLSVDKDGSYVLTASYVGGAVQCLPLLASGSLSPALGTIINSGKGPNTDRQEASHMHWIQADPKGKFIYSCDLGTDLVQCYKFDPSVGGLSKVPTSDGHMPPGSGPRHGAFSRDGKFLYVNAEMGNSVTVFSVNSKNGALTAKQTISTLNPDGHSIGSAEIAIHPKKNWLYVSNRGDDSIAMFAIGKDGLLKQLQVAKCGVHIPRGFAIDPTGTWLIAAGQESNDLVSIPIDPTNGNLGKPLPPVKLGAPVCIVFAR